MGGRADQYESIFAGIQNNDMTLVDQCLEKHLAKKLFAKCCIKHSENFFILLFSNSSFITLKLSNGFKKLPKNHMKQTFFYCLYRKFCSQIIIHHHFDSKSLLNATILHYYRNSF